MAVKEVRASHILVATEKEAHSILEQLRAGKKFGELARKHSSCGSAAEGGDLGYFTRDKMVKEFSDAAFVLNKGQYSGPVKTEFGYHIILVTDKK